MILRLRLLGLELLYLEVHRDRDDDEPEPERGPPFGFSGGAGVQAELARDYVLAEADG